jgi:hypothetical protein
MPKIRHIAIYASDPDKMAKVDLSTKGLSLERQHIKEKLGHA